MVRFFICFLCLFPLYACGSKTTVILLPEEDGTTGSVVVKTKSAATTLNQPYTSTSVTDDTSVPDTVSVDQQKIQEDYNLLLKAEPAKPARFILYFNNDAVTLTDESLKLIPRILETARDREPSEISVIGHTDSVGSSEHNNRLSLQRAKQVEVILTESGTDLKRIYLKSHGENDPLIPTEDGVAESRNRRVEIMIR